MNTSVLIIVGVVVAICLLLATGVRPRVTYVRRAVLTDAELRFFFRLVDAVAEGDHVCPQLSMAAALETRGGNREAAHAAFRRISQKQMDFCVCDRQLMPKFVVELDDRTHDTASARGRDRDRDAILDGAGIPTLRFDVRRMPTAMQLRAAFVEIQAAGSLK